MRTMTMPKNWSSGKGWERYYTSLYPDGEYHEHEGGFGSIGRHLDKFSAELNEKGWRSIWVPGVGLSPLARVLSELGFDVHATDISPTAIAFQQSDANDVAGYLEKMEPAERPGSFVCEVHDFTQLYFSNQFDFILNVKAFQGFSPEPMSQIAKVHYDALKPGRQAFFDTQNVQGERRDSLEGSLVDAGFFLPFFELTRWYRQALRETNIPHVFILGLPMIQRIGDYKSGTGDAKWESDIKTLRDIMDEYRQKAQVEQEKESSQDKAARKATVIYNTG